MYISVLTTQQALPKSAILTCSLSAFTGSRGFTNILPDAPVKERRGKGEGAEEGDVEMQGEENI